MRRPCHWPSFSLVFSLLLVASSLRAGSASIAPTPVAPPAQLEDIVNQLANSIQQQASGPCTTPEFSDKLYSELCDEGVKAMQQNKTADGFACFAKAFKLEPQTPRAAILLALGLKQLKDCTNAKYFLEYAHQQNPKLGEIYTIFAQCHLGEDGMQNLDEAIEILNKGISYEGTPLAYYELGNAYRKKGDIDSAVSTFQEAHSKFDLSDDVWYTEMGRALQDGKRYDEALIYMTFSVIEKPENPHYHYNLASILEKMERYDDAISSLERCLEINPNIVDARKRIGNIQLKAGRSKEALKAYKAALEKAPDDEALRAVIVQLEKPAFWDEVDEEIDGLEESLGSIFDEDEVESTPKEERTDASRSGNAGQGSATNAEPKPKQPAPEEEEDEWW